jgi:hypothetical protein
MTGDKRERRKRREVIPQVDIHKWTCDTFLVGNKVADVAVEHFASCLLFGRS